MNARTIGTVAGIGALLAAGPALAEGLEGRLSIVAQAGTQSEVSGDLLNATTGTLLARPVTLDAQRYRDVFSSEWRFQGQLGYGVGTRVELILRGAYYQADGNGVEAGTYGQDPLYAFFTDYEEWSAEIGLRYYIAHQGRLKSYVAAVVGLRTYEDLFVDYEAPDAASAVLNVPFFEAGTVPAFGADIGVSFDLTEKLFIGLDSGIRWQSAPTGTNALPGIPGADDSSSRWTAPVAFSLGVRF
jgi:hypothetical protein